MAADLLPGFADPAMGSQRCFRAVLDAMARPGQLRDVGAAVRPPPPLGTAAAAVLLTLADADTPLLLDAALAPARPWVAFHCGAPFTEAPGQAAFAVFPAWPAAFAHFAAGTDEAPERGTTLVLQLPALDGGARLVLSGPGLREAAPFRPAGLPPDFPEQWAANQARFPRGVDLILCAGNALAALPRTTTVRRG